jgi:hypothetical protein
MPMMRGQELPCTLRHVVSSQRATAIVQWPVMRRSPTLRTGCMPVIARGLFIPAQEREGARSHNQAHGDRCDGYTAPPYYLWRIG